MSTLVSELITRCRRRLNETATTFHSDEDLIDYADEAQRYIAMETRPLETTGTDTIDSTQTNPEQYSLPTDFLAMRRITLDGHDLFKTYFAEIREAEIRESDQTGDPEMYYEWNDVIYLLPIPGNGNDGETLKYWYWKKPTILTATTDTLEIGSEWDDVVIPYMEYLAWKKDGEPDFADYAMTESNLKMVSIKRQRKEDTVTSPPRFRVSDNLRSRDPLHLYRYRSRYEPHSSGFRRRA